MLKIAAITVAIFFICGITFVVTPSALCFEDYITSETTIQEAEGEETEEAPVMGGGGLYDEEVKDEVETIEEQEITEQEELQGTEELQDEQELEK
jgi:hypothetical protein